MPKTTRDLLIVLGLLGVFALLLPQRWPSGPSGVPDAGGVRPQLLNAVGRGSGRGVSKAPAPSAVLPASPTPQSRPAEAPAAPAESRPHYTVEAQARRDPMVSLLPDQTRDSESAATGHTPSDTAWRDASHLAPTAVGALSVEGMVWGAARTQALINGELYEVGDVVEGARILSIERAGVTVEVGGIRHVVSQGQRGYPQPHGR